MGRSGGRNKKQSNLKTTRGAIFGSAKIGTIAESQEDIEEQIDESDSFINENQDQYINSYQDNHYDLESMDPNFSLGPIKTNEKFLILAKSETLVDYNSPTNKEYRVYVLIGPIDSGETGYISVGFWGPGGNGMSQKKAYYQGSSLQDARSAGTKILQQKLDKGYSGLGTLHQLA